MVGGLTRIESLIRPHRGTFSRAGRRNGGRFTFLSRYGRGCPKGR